MGKTRNGTANGIDLVKGYGDGGFVSDDNSDSEGDPGVTDTSPTRNLEVPIAICITGIVYLALLYSVIWYLE